jgi:hypothetical protein
MFTGSDLKGFLKETSTHALSSTKATEDMPVVPLIETASCKICDVKFNLLFGIKRFHCKFCGSSVCQSHSLRRRQKGSEMMRICDLCEEDSLKNDLKNELVSEIWALERELETTKRENERHKTDDQQQRLEIRQLEEELSVGRLIRQQTLEALKTKIEEEIKKGLQVKANSEDIRRNIDQLNLEEQQVTKEIKAQQSESAVFQVMISDKTLELLRLQGQDRYLEEQLSDRVSKDELVSLLCDECFGAVELL